LNAGYDEFLRAQNPETGAAHEWGFLRPRYTLTLAEHITGTSTGIYDGTTYTVVTATAAAFTPTMVGGLVSFATVTGSFTVYSYTSETVITVVGDATHAAKVFTIDSGGVFALPADFFGFLGPPTYVYTAESRGPLAEAGEADIRREYYRDGYSQGLPRHYAVLPQTFVTATGQRWSLFVGPPPDADRAVIFPYRSRPIALTDATAVFPIGGEDHGYTILAYAKKHVEMSRGVLDGRWANEAKAQMLVSIDLDRRLYSSRDRPLSLRRKRE